MKTKKNLEKIDQDYIDRLYQSNAIVEDRHYEIAERQRDRENEICTFTPNILPKSREMGEKLNNKPLHLRVQEELDKRNQGLEAAKKAKISKSDQEWEEIQAVKKRIATQGYSYRSKV